MTPTEALRQSYQALTPFSQRFTVDFKRTLFVIEQLAAALPDFRDKKILDIGCGIGLSVGALHALGANAQGIDKYIFDPANTLFHVQGLEQLQSLWKKESLNISSADFFASQTPFPANSFDVVLNDAMIEHLRDPRAFLERVHQVLKPGGRLLISTPNLTTFLRRVRFLCGYSPMWDLKEFYTLGETFTGHWREYTLQELEQLCKWSGFTIVNAWNKNMLAPFKLNKLPRFIARLLSACIPGSRDMNFVLCKKNS